MILPTKNLDQNTALIEVGVEILRLLTSAKTNSSLWDDFKKERTKFNKNGISYDWYVLTLDFLFMLGTIQLDNGKIIRTNQK